MSVYLKIKELEFKYDITDSTLTISEFVKFCKKLSPEKRVDVSSWDVYYSPKKSGHFKFDFLRYRKGQEPQLTQKIKTNKTNNNDRYEIDLPLDSSQSESDLDLYVESFVKNIGFKENFRIFKNCVIFYLSKVDIVYYVVYDENLKEKGRFVEIEARKDVVFESKDEAWAHVKLIEEKCAEIGLTWQNRTKRSQWERWKR